MAEARERRKIAILGSGMAALAAAFELTELDPKRERFDISVHTIGWRLGGKGAVGRDLAQRGRPEEHGLHVWAGFYDNAFDILRRVYAAMRDEVGRPPPFGDWRAAFIPLTHCTLMEEVGGQWLPWRIPLPGNELLPGISGRAPFPSELLVALVNSLQSLVTRSGMDAHPAVTDEHRTSLAGAHELANAMPAHPALISRESGARLGDLLRRARVPADRLGAASSPDRDLARAAIVAELAASMAIGMIEDEVLFRGFDGLDGEDWRAWLARHGCSKATLESAPVRACYDYVFGYRPQARGRAPNFGAGTGMVALLRFLFDFKGAVLWAPRPTLGEAVFAPLYRVLAHRGVRFEFFRRIEKLSLAPDGRSLGRVDYSIQARVKGGGAYRPLVGPDAKLFPEAARAHLEFWPSHPLRDQLDPGPKRGPPPTLDKLDDLESDWTEWPGVGRGRLVHRSLRRPGDRDEDVFDSVILGIGLGALPRICADFAGMPDGRWKRMFERVKTTPTLALQSWSGQAASALAPWSEANELMTGFAWPLDSWGDNSQLLAFDMQPASAPLRSCDYFVGTYPVSEARLAGIDAPDRRAAREAALALGKQAESAAADWIKNSLGALWPGLAGKPAETYLRLNINGSDRYVQSVAGSLDSRMSPDGSGIAYLYLAGDWTRTGLDAGCMEAAAMSGRIAVNAITGANMQVPGQGLFDELELPVPLLSALGILRRSQTLLNGGAGSIDGCCAIEWFDDGFVAKLLPPRLALRPLASGGPQGKHPLVMIFGRYRNVRPGFLPPPGIRYHEFALVVPSVVETEGLGQWTCNYMPYLFLDKLAPVVIGDAVYGFNKQLARFRVRSDGFDIRTAQGPIYAEFHNASPPGGLDDILPDAHDFLSDLMENPTIGVTASGKSVYCYLDFHLTEATFQKLKGKIWLAHPFVPSGKPAEIAIEPLEESGRPKAWRGGIRLVADWTLSLPVPGHVETAAGRTSADARLKNRKGPFRRNWKRK